MAWEQWQQVTAQLKRQQFMAGAAVWHILHRKFSQAWEQWQQATVNLKRQEILL